MMIASLLFADRYLVEMIFIGVFAMALSGAHLWRLGGRVKRVELRLATVATAASMAELRTELVTLIERERRVDDTILAQANESIRILRQLNDNQVSNVNQLAQRMDLFLSDELRKARTSGYSPAPILSVA